MNENLKSLSLYVEQDQFVEYQGGLFYVGDDIESLEAQGFQFEEADIENSDYICSRRNIGCPTLEPKPYVEGFNLGEEDQHKFEGARVVKEGTGILPDSAFIIVRQLKESPSDPKNKHSHIIYNRDDGKYYCMSNTCTECDVVPIKVPNKYQVTSADIAAQEPLCSTLVTREPEWAKVFELRNFRTDPTLVQYLDLIVEEHLKIPRRDNIYINWVHDTYFYGQTELYKLNLLVNQCKQDETKRPALAEQIEFLLSDFEAFRQKKLAQ